MKVKKGVTVAMLCIAGVLGVNGSVSDGSLRESAMDIRANMSPATRVPADADAEISLEIIWHTIEPIYGLAADDDDFYMSSVLRKDANLNRVFLYATGTLKGVAPWLYVFCNNHSNKESPFVSFLDI